MKKILSPGFYFLFCGLISLFSANTADAKDPKKVLVVTATVGFPHSSCVTAEKVLVKLGEETKAFSVVDVIRSGPRPQDPAAAAAWEEKMRKDFAEKMSPAALADYDAIIFANTTGDLPLPDKQAFLNWIKSGKAFVGMHSATDTFGGHKPLDPYVEMIGGEFKTHPPGLYDVECVSVDPRHPARKPLPQPWPIKDEIYILNGYEPTKVHQLLKLDKHPVDKSPADLPIAWCKDYGKGKVFYTALGHAEAVWESESYQQHILGGIKWALGLARGNSKPQTAAK